MRGPNREPYLLLMSPTSSFARGRIRAVICALSIVAGACTTAGASVSGSEPPPSSVVARSREGISIESLEGKILFTRAGGEFGDETVFTMDADGAHEQRITDFGATCCPRWSPDGEHILLTALTEDDRITTEIVGPDGTHERTLPATVGESQPRVHPGVVHGDGSTRVRGRMGPRDPGDLHRPGVGRSGSRPGDEVLLAPQRPPARVSRPTASGSTSSRVRLDGVRVRSSPWPPREARSVR